MISTDLVCLISPHDQSNILGAFVPHELHVTNATFLPLRRVGLEVKSKELGTPTEGRQEDKMCQYGTALLSLLLTS